MLLALFILIVAQSIAILVDQFYFHRRRELEQWELIGHPVDTGCFFVCLIIPLFVSLSPISIEVFAGLSLLSCLVITKDEWIHAESCSGGEQWLHALLFILHPVLLIGVFILWACIDQPATVSNIAALLTITSITQTEAKGLLTVLCLQTGLYLLYQMISGGISMKRILRPESPDINNEFYDDLGKRWYTAKDDPVALLRAESRLKNTWVLNQIVENIGNRPCKILDVGCGGGFLSNALAEAGHQVTAIDLSQESLDVAKQYDKTRNVHYQKMNAHHLKFDSASFDVVCVMDFLEHVFDKEKVIQEIGRVLRKGGLCFFHTFNKNWVSGLVVIKGVEWFVKNTPPNMHVYELFISPKDLKKLCEKKGMEVLQIRGIRPRIFRSAFWKMLVTGNVDESFQFVFSKSLLTGYIGIARKQAVENSERILHYEARASGTL
jgi:2-polyprenyl-6-hydroxyphenyl methylase / 3-demethylubiquinone-9 3-methyltransferase